MKKAQLKSHANRGTSVGTRWGPVTFDAQGEATIEVQSEEELQMLRHLGWLVEVAPEAGSSLSSSDAESAALSDSESDPEHMRHGSDTKSLHPVKPKKR